MNYTPLKWTGSKRVFADFILERINKDSIRHYIEPFAGGANIGLKLAEAVGSQIESYQFSDNNEDLIDLWQLILDNPASLYRYYEMKWGNINYIETIEDRKEFYYHVRTIFNLFRGSRRVSTENRAKEFYFLLRTCYNGMVRYNGNGDFNSPYHFTRKGMHPDKVGKILIYWSYLLKELNVSFTKRDYQWIFNTEHPEGTFIFVDPPYVNVKKNSIYSGNINHDELFDGLNNLPDHVSWALTIDGDCDLSMFDGVIVESLGSNSSFKRMKGAGAGKTTTEKLVLKTSSKYIAKNQTLTEGVTTR